MTIIVSGMLPAGFVGFWDDQSLSSRRTAGHVAFKNTQHQDSISCSLGIAVLYKVHLLVLSACAGLPVGLG
jgi:hypothetical protein